MAYLNHDGYIIEVNDISAQEAHRTGWGHEMQSIALYDPENAALFIEAEFGCAPAPQWLNDFIEVCKCDDLTGETIWQYARIASRNGAH